MFNRLLSEIKIGDLLLSNRLVVPPMVVNMFDRDGVATEQYIEYITERAKGGFGLIITENLGISPEARAFARNGGIWNDVQAERLSVLTGKVHSAGGKIAAQLYHAGRETLSAITGSNNVAPSPFRDPTVAEVPLELTLDGIAGIVDDFGAAAARAVAAGFDAIEIHCAHGYLINQFLSPFSNKRTDEYGGTFYNRTRFAREILRKVKASVGNTPLLCRISAEELVSGGMTENDMVAFALMLEEEGVAAIDVSFGIFTSGGRIAASIYHEHAGMTYLAAQIRHAVRVPVIAVGRINDPYYAEAVLAKGDADMIAIGRGSLADPYFPLKVREGRPESIDCCIGCRQVCNACLFAGEPVSCIVNPVCGEEYKGFRMTQTPKRILVIGGGLAGMRFAATAAKRGHSVTLAEKTDRLGGQWLLAMTAPGKQEYAHLLNSLRRELAEQGVKVMYNRQPTKEEQKEYDVVVAATGASAKQPDIPVERATNVFTEAQVLAGGIDTPQHVYVCGMGGNPLAVAAMLGGQLKNVTVVSKNRLTEKYGDASIDEMLQKQLCGYGVEFITGSHVSGITENGILLAEGGSIELSDTDGVVLCTGYGKTQAEIAEGAVYIGDALHVRNAAYAIRTAYDAALEV